MRLWRRRPVEPVAPRATEPPLPAVRLERAIVALASHAAQLNDRVDRLERRLEDAEDTAFAALAPGGIDTLARQVDLLTTEAVAAEEVLELRLHTTRLTSELTRLQAELREQADRTRRLEAMASVIDLTDDGDWAASA